MKIPVRVTPGFFDHDPHYLAQARWAAAQFDLQDRVEFRQAGVYDTLGWNESFDLVWFMGVFYHLRYPLLALDSLARLSRRMMVFQTLTLPGKDIYPDATWMRLREIGSGESKPFYRYPPAVGIISLA